MGKRVKHTANVGADAQLPESATTQRAYTLRLRGVNPVDNSWRDALWATHDAINNGAKAFGDWLLTLRGGLDHALAEPPPPAKGKKRSEDEAASIRKSRRILLALSWLNVEDDRGAPKVALRVAIGRDADSVRREQLLAALRSILAGRRVTKAEIESWVADCADSLAAKVRDDAVWINRSDLFDSAVARAGPSLSREETWDILEPFFGSREAFLAPVHTDGESVTGGEEKAKDLVQKAGQWLSSRFGTGPGADFGSMAKVYSAMAGWADGARAFRSGAEALKSLASGLGRFNPVTADADGILSLISGPGYKSATRNVVKSWGVRADAISKDDLQKLMDTAAADAEKCKSNVGGKGRRAWSDELLADVEKACGFTYLQTDGPARHSEFAVMLDHAARRVSIGHSWIKRAESERRRFEEDAVRLRDVPPVVGARLDRYVAERSGTSGASTAGGEYRIRRRAIEGWDDVVKRWKRAACKTAEDRIAAAREAQAEDEDGKFGDIQLFEALAADDAECVWRIGGKADPAPLRDYVLGHDARDKQRRFKVPAYRHPDALRHPVFCDFGNSRWEVQYAVLEAAKAVRGGRRVAPKDAAWIKDRRAMRMGLWDGHSLRDIDLLWGSKRLMADLALGADAGGAPARDVARAARLGRAAAGLRTGEKPSVAGLFAQGDWNARLQAPRCQLDNLAKRVDKHGWDALAVKMRDNLPWLATFSAKLECRGPFIEYATAHQIIGPARIQVAPRNERDEWRGLAYPFWHPDNEGRRGHGKLILSRLPGLRVLSVDLGHRYAAACAVWEALGTAEFKREVAGRAVAAGGAGKHDLVLHTRHTDQRTGKERTAIYRRIGPDTLADGSAHPAPWARLDRQFLIKLQGEEQPARAAASKPEHGINEVSLVAELATTLGLIRDEDAGVGRGVDELMRRAMRIATLGLKRHGRRAKIAYALHPECPGIPGMGGSLNPIHRGDEHHVRFLTNALADWHALATDADWDGSAARALWNKHIEALPGGFEVHVPATPDPSSESPMRQQRRKAADELREQRIKPIAEHLARSPASTTKAMHLEWAAQWAGDDGEQRTRDDFEHTLLRDGTGSVVGSRTSPKKGKETGGGWHARLRLLTDWIMGRHLPGAESDRWSRKVGGLSLTRIATMRSLYQLHKAFDMRPRPQRVQGAPKFGESNTGIAQGVLNAMERMREQRVKQIASRIAAAALGLGGHWKTVERRDARGLVLLGDDGKPRMKSVWVEEPSPRYAACHAVVIESLRNYRPDELQTRRENRALMNWSSGKVRKYLEEACQLHGLHLREVMPNYTSRQCSRTGLPGMRCEDVPVDPATGAVKAYWWGKALAGAQKKREDGSKDAEAHFLVELAEHLTSLKKEGKRLPPTVRVPRKGGDLFVAAPPRSGEPAAERRATQADLNAAANIGLRALLDPDFAGRWWYVPCIEDKGAGTAVPRADKVRGSACFGPDPAKPERFGSLAPPRAADEAATPVRRGKLRGQRSEASGMDTTNFWTDPSASALRPASTGFWLATPAYWLWVRKRVVNGPLRVWNGLAAGPLDPDAHAW